jgi:hypothetical protein
LNNGYELRQVEVLIDYDVPKVGWKRIIRLDTNAVLRDEEMTAAERQRGFGFSEE